MFIAIRTCFPIFRVNLTKSIEEIQRTTQAGSDLTSHRFTHAEFLNSATKLLTGTQASRLRAAKCATKLPNENGAKSLSARNCAPKLRFTSGRCSIHVRNESWVTAL